MQKITLIALVLSFAVFETNANAKSCEFVTREGDTCQFNIDGSLLGFSMKDPAKGCTSFENLVKANQEDFTDCLFPKG